MSKREFGLVRSADPFAVLRQMTGELDRFFEQSEWPSFRLPAFRLRPFAAEGMWSPRIDVFEKDNRMFTRIDLPGLKKEDVKVEAVDGQLVVSGERKEQTEETKENYYRCEREYGSFYRAVPLPEGVALDDVKATFADGVLEVSVPLPAKVEPKPRTIAIEEGGKAKAAA